MLFIEKRAPRSESPLVASFRVDTTKTWTILASDALAELNIPVAPVTSTPMLHPARPNDTTAAARAADSLPVALIFKREENATNTVCLALKSTRPIPSKIRDAVRSSMISSLQPLKKPHRNDQDVNQRGPERYRSRSDTRS